MITSDNMLPTSLGGVLGVVGTAIGSQYTQNPLVLAQAAVWGTLTGLVISTLIKAHKLVIELLSSIFLGAACLSGICFFHEYYCVRNLDVVMCNYAKFATTALLCLAGGGIIKVFYDIITYVPSSLIHQAEEYSNAYFGCIGRLYKKAFSKNKND